MSSMQSIGRLQRSANPGGIFSTCNSVSKDPVAQRYDSHERSNVVLSWPACSLSAAQRRRELSPGRKPRVNATMNSVAA
jgi:hypothetical protein